MLEKLKDAHTLDCIPGTTKGEMGDIWHFANCPYVIAATDQATVVLERQKIEPSRENFLGNSQSTA